MQRRSFVIGAILLSFIFFNVFLANGAFAAEKISGGGSSGGGGGGGGGGSW